MNMKLLQRLPSKEEIRELLPVSAKAQQARNQKIMEIKNIFEGKDPRFLLIIGPCSADQEDSVIEYISRLANIQDAVKDQLLLVPRIYTNKPRTTGGGYKGMLHQPDPNKAPDMSEGIKAMRKLHIRSLESFHMPAADEMLYPDNYSYLDDILGYIAIGARSVENQQHRLTSSGVDIPVGMKNPTGGDLSIMLNAINAAQQGHRFIYRGYDVESTGNPFTHAILRGAVDLYGKNIPNYHYEDLKFFCELYENTAFANKAIIVDTNHANSMKRYQEQPRIAKEILWSRRYDPTIKNMVKGLMIESYLEEGCQPVTDTVYGKSITDPCLGWSDTEKLIYDIADNV
ncbi:3-deoxy-7-phosphoheptulonate synthase [Alkalibacter rhizosphaerae]|uniref:Phospho-2-dehydro-3-deoxyheptonate aldolase n=1 Tax=Alkalibacter rhizosphaerae TaxID=2815577 RepID=A0A975AHW1_9FIRM|nr:3-deoxy-7-phosphoheptulonate synthase [Alkalibacter rhizosphaerae]QSX08857.1 3-deoxy-7-phosphoheptulonate synthase [Alkalibacter rhizosphaerae]